MKVEIEGIIVFDTNGKKYIHREFMRKEHCEDGTFPEYVFICDHTISIDVDDIDLVSPQLASLDAKEKDLNLKYNQALQHIKVARNNLLALEN